MGLCRISAKDAAYSLKLGQMLTTNGTIIETRTGVAIPPSHLFRIFFRNYSHPLLTSYS